MACPIKTFKPRRAMRSPGRERLRRAPSDNGLGNALGSFFQSFNELNNNPEDLDIRTTVIQSGDALARVFQSVQQRLDVQSQQLTNKVGVDMNSLNSYGAQIAALNITIRQATAQDQQANDLMDKRDQLIDKLAALANISVINKPDGTANVSVGTSDLVVGVNAYSLSLTGPNSLTARGDLTGGESPDCAGADRSGRLSDRNSIPWPRPSSRRSTPSTRTAPAWMARPGWTSLAARTRAQ